MKTSRSFSEKIIKLLEFVWQERPGKNYPKLNTKKYYMSFQSFAIL